MRFHHTALSVKDLEISVSFYKSNFGFVEAKRFERPDLGGKAAFLSLGDANLEIWQFDRQKDAQDDFSDLNVRGYKHIGLQVEDIQKTYDELKEKGLAVSMPKQGAVAKYIFVKDPDGLPVEILELSAPL